MAVLAPLLAPPLARAEPPKLPRTMRIYYDDRDPNTKSCPEMWEFADLVRGTAQRNLFENRSMARLEVKVSSTGRGYFAHAEIHDGEGILAFTADSQRRPLCKDVVEEVGLALGNALGDVSALEPSPTLPWRVRLDFSHDKNAASCGTAREVERAVVRYMFWNPFISPEALFRLSVRIRRHADDGPLEGIAELRSPNGVLLWSRSHIIDDCFRLVTFLGFSIGHMLDPVVDAYPPDKGPPPERRRWPMARSPAPVAAELPPPSKAELPPLQKEEPVRSPVERARFEAGLGGALAIQTGPSVYALDLMGEVGFRWRWFSLDGEIHYSPPAGADAPDAPAGARVQASRLVGGIAPCGHVSVLFGCALVQVGALFATSSGVVMPRPTTNLIAAGGGRLGFEVPIGGSFMLRTSLDLLGTASLVALRIDQRPQWMASSFNAVVGGGVAAKF